MFVNRGFNPQLKSDEPKAKKKKKIAHRRKERASDERKYGKESGEWLAGRCCEHCGCKATEVHHKAGRIGGRLGMKEFWMAVCRRCHKWIEENNEIAKELGYSINSTIKLKEE